MLSRRLEKCLKYLLFIFQIEARKRLREAKCMAERRVESERKSQQVFSVYCVLNSFVLVPDKHLVLTV